MNIKVEVKTRARTVKRYNLQPQITLDIPKGAEILTVRELGDDIVMWVMCDESASLEKRHFTVVETGRPLPSGNLKYLNTSILFDISGTREIHVFEAFK